jgi:hypothetical protein
MNCFVLRERVTIAFMTRAGRAIPTASFVLALAWCTAVAATGCGKTKAEACADVVATPGGLVPRQCVHEVPDGANITTDDRGFSTVTLNGKVVATYPPCPCGGITIGGGPSPDVDASAGGAEDASDAPMSSPPGICHAGCLCASTPASCPIGCYRYYTDQPDAGLEFAFCSNGPPDGADAGVSCTYDHGGAPGQPADFSAGCPPAGCPAGTVCVSEGGGVAGGGGAYCAPIPIECHGIATCACMGVCACRSGGGLVPELCSDNGGGGISCDNGVR